MRARPAPRAARAGAGQSEEGRPVGTEASVGLAAAALAVSFGSSERGGALVAGLVATGLGVAAAGFFAATTSVAVAAAAFAVCAGSAERAGALAVGLVGAGLGATGSGLAGTGLGFAATGLGFAATGSGFAAATGFFAPAFGLDGYAPVRARSRPLPSPCAA